MWRCNHKFDNSRKCKTPNLDEETIKKSFVSAMNKLITHKNDIISDLETIKSELHKSKNTQTEQIDLLIGNLEKQGDTVTEFDECLWLSLVDFITVNSKGDIRVTFKNGTAVQA
jgi:hypothetical protein